MNSSESEIDLISDNGNDFGGNELQTVMVIIITEFMNLRVY